MQAKEVCWNITTKCNQNCKYCHRFLNIDDLEFESNAKILNNLIEDGVQAITWTGGEALLYPNLIKLLQIAKEHNIRNKLITNGMLLLNEEIKPILKYLDNLTLSIDSINDKVNTEVGRGKQHFENIKNILEYSKANEIPVSINTVVSKKNMKEINELGNFLSNYDIKSWRVFKFMPLRETAQRNRDNFEITDKEFEECREQFQKFNKMNLEFRKENDMESKYILLVANGDIIETKNGVDVRKGNALYQNLMDFID